MPKPDWVEIVERATAGDGAARAELMVRFTPLVRSTAARLVPSDDVDDVTQETVAAAMTELAGLRTPEAFPAWLRLIVRKHAARHRSSGLTPTVDLESAAKAVTSSALADDPAEAVVRRHDSALVRAALAASSLGDRRILELRYLAGWSNPELAEHLGISPGAVRKRLHDARRRIRPHLEDLNPKETTMTDLDRFLGLVHPPDLTVPDPPRLRRAPHQRTVTGLKVLDTMVPVRRGGTIEMTGPFGTGQVVLALELLYRFGRTPNDIACVAVGLAGAAIGSQPDIAHVIDEPGIPGPAAAIMCTDVADAPQALAVGGRLAAGLAGVGRDVILLVDGPCADHLAPDTAPLLAGLADEGSVTLVAVRPSAHGDDPGAPLGLDATIVFSIEQFSLGIFPAVDPATSSSRVTTSVAATAAGAQLERAARTSLWFHQDLFIAADATGHDGTWVEPDDAERELSELVR